MILFDISSSYSIYEMSQHICQIIGTARISLYASLKGRPVRFVSFSSAYSRLHPNEEEWDARFSVSDREWRKHPSISFRMIKKTIIHSQKFHLLMKNNQTLTFRMIKIKKNKNLFCLAMLYFFIISLRLHDTHKILCY